MKTEKTCKVLGIPHVLCLMSIISILAVKTAFCIAVDTVAVPQLQIGGIIYWSSFSPDGKKIIAKIDVACISVWDIATGVRQNILDTNQAFLDTTIRNVALKNDPLLACSPDGLLKITAKPYVDTIYVRDASSDSLLLKIAAGIASGYTLKKICFSPDGSKILSCAQDNFVKIWELSSGKLLQQLAGHTDVVWSGYVSPDGTTALTASADKTVKLWDVASGTIIRTIEGHAKGVPSAVFSHDGKLILSCSWDKSAKIWSAETGELLRTFEGHTEGLVSAEFSPDDSMIITRSDYYENVIKLWKVNSGEVVKTYVMSTHTQPSSVGTFSNDGLRIVTGSEDRCAILWNAVTGEPIRKCIGHNGKITSIAFSPDDSKILSGSSDSTAILWNSESGASVHQFTNHKSKIYSVAFTKDGSKICTGHGDTTAILWDVKTGDSIKTLFCQNGPVFSVDFSPDGTQMLTCTRALESAIRIWDVQTGSVIRSFSYRDKRPFSATYSSNGKMVLAWYYDSSAVVWNTVDGTQIIVVKDSSKINSASFSPDGQTILTGSSTSKIWDVTTGKLIRVFNAEAYRGGGSISVVRSNSFSPDGNKVLSILNSEGLKAFVWSNQKTLIKKINFKNMNRKKTVRVKYDRNNNIIIQNLVIPAGKVTVELFSLNGKCIVQYDKIYKRTAGNDVIFNVNLPNGPYVVRLMNSNKVVLFQCKVTLLRGTTGDGVK